ncbi:tetratricopeptide repeat protein [Crocosphaera sp. UHCC 0190]|uniref:tetratricopeptide repeat protein n=1 Tax=Crocosphaera sp. UHCC 0190 TaxID=3110246 RepID=UPI002B2181C5|nr:tetratricopeptide repeat protein [Crocosphaera sp. UHCC 0190]MEA5508611.1 tetratricopeptide repeat protein [Crocosphaera sp. UHCC 0190]
MDAKLEQFYIKYQAGQDLLQRGQYRLSVQTLEEAKALINPSSSLGGDVQMCLVTAYQGVGRLEDAIAVCEELTRHPNLEVRQQSKRVLYILKAPKLKRPDAWMTKIPSTNPEETDNPRYLQAKPISKPQEKPTLEVEDLSQINTKDNAFVWVALALLLIILGCLAWL